MNYIACCSPTRKHVTRKPWFYFSGVTFCSALILSLAVTSVLAIEDAGLFDLSLEELTKVEIKSDITSIRAKSIREQPGIVSVITAVQVRETGARDLSEILMLVPGFSMDVDVQSMIGLTFRGLQGQEGKVLLVVDGIEVNEPYYGSLPILNHIPASAIQQVEIIRGPGSAAYGGSAGLSVIRVTTKGADQNGGYAVWSPSYAEGRWAWKYGAGAGYTEGDWRFSFNGSYSDDYLSNQKYVSQSGAEVDLTDVSDMKPLFIDADLGYRDLDLRLIVDLYRYDDSVGFGDPPLSPTDTRFDSIMASAKYDFRVTPKLKVTPQFTYKHLIPWNVSDPAAVGTFDMVDDRYQGDLTAVAELTGNSSLMLGGRSIHDVSRPAYSLSKETPSAYDDIAGFAQYDLDTRWVNVSIGGRYEHHEVVGGGFVPRIALTRAWDALHFKALYSEAYRIPGIQVIKDAIGEQIECEHTRNYEFEAGYKFSDSLSWVANIFYMQVKKPIIYDSGGSGSGLDGYYNASNSLSTYGLESELKWNLPYLSTWLTYAYYRADENDIDYLRGADGYFLAAPAHKLTLSETWHVTKALDLNVNAYWLGRRYAYLTSSGEVSALDPEFVINTYLGYRHHHFSYGLGIVDLLDADRYAPQPYDGGSGPLILKGREFVASLTYNF